MLRRHLKRTFAHSIHFVTTTVVERGNWFVEPEVCIRALETLEQYRKYYELLCIGYCLMPDHIHILFHQQREGREESRAVVSSPSRNDTRLPYLIKYPQHQLAQPLTNSNKTKITLDHSFKIY